MWEFQSKKTRGQDFIDLWAKAAQQALVARNVATGSALVQYYYQ